MPGIVLNTGIQKQTKTPAIMELKLKSKKRL